MRRLKNPIDNRHGPNPSDSTFAEGPNMEQVGDSNLELHVTLYDSPTVNTAHSIQLEPNKDYGTPSKKSPLL